MSDTIKTKTIIVGSGPAGYTAAIYAARSNLEPVLVSGYQEGGQLTLTTDVENYPGFAKTIQGPWLVEQMKLQAESVDVKIIQDKITKIDFQKKSSKDFFSLEGESGKYEAQTIILATGSQAKWLGIPSETKFKGYGVSGCATCDAFFYKNKKVIVVGGGSTAAEEAIFLTNYASEVSLVHRRDTLSAEPILQERLLKNSKVKVIWDTQIHEITGTEDKQKNVTGVKLENVKTKEITNKDIDGVFIAIGHKPATDFLQSTSLKLNEGYIVTTAGTSLTNIDGVFAAGDVCDKHYRQAVIAAGNGCVAALDALKYIDSSK